MKPRFCETCCIHRQVVDHPTLGPICGYCMGPFGVQVQRTPGTLGLTAHERASCPRCGAPEGELCLNLNNKNASGARRITALARLPVAHAERQRRAEERP